MKLDVPKGWYLCYPGTRTLGHWRTFETREQGEFVREQDKLAFFEVVEVAQ